MIWVNFKLIESTFGDNAVIMAKTCAKVASETKVKIAVVASPFEIYRISQEVGIETWVQSVDQYNSGRRTGRISATQALANGAVGTLVNHSENKIPKGTIATILKNRPKNFKIMVAVRSLKQAEFWAKKKPDYLAFEPSSLIGSKDKSVATEMADVIGKMVMLVAPTRLVLGAGIKSNDDVVVVKKHGGVGILVSSIVVESKDPYGALLKLAQGFGE